MHGWRQSSLALSTWATSFLGRNEIGFGLVSVLIEFRFTVKHILQGEEFRLHDLLNQSVALGSHGLNQVRQRIEVHSTFDIEYLHVDTSRLHVAGQYVALAVAAVQVYWNFLANQFGIVLVHGREVRWGIFTPIRNNRDSICLDDWLLVNRPLQPGPNRRTTIGIDPLRIGFDVLVGLASHIEYSGRDRIKEHDLHLTLDHLGQRGCYQPRRFNCLRHGPRLVPKHEPVPFNASHLADLALLKSAELVLETFVGNGLGRTGRFQDVARAFGSLLQSLLEGTTQCRI